MNKIVIYEPDNSIKKGYLNIFLEIFSEIKNNWWLIYQFFKRDLLASYKQTFVGIFWAFLMPLVSIGAFLLLNKSGILKTGGIHVPYPLYAMLGLAFWQVFSSGIVACSNSLVNAGSMIVKINFSKKSLVIASIGQPILSFSIQMVITFSLFIYYGIKPSLIVVLLPFLLMPILFFTIGLGFILSLVNGIMRDVGNILSVIVTFIMFITPVFYVKPTEGILSSITRFNPLYYLISVPRDLILKGEIEELGCYLIICILSITTFIVCIAVFHLTETRIAERV